MNLGRVESARPLRSSTDARREISSQSICPSIDRSMTSISRPVRAAERHCGCRHGGARSDSLVNVAAAPTSEHVCSAGQQLYRRVAVHRAAGNLTANSHRQLYDLLRREKGRNGRGTEFGISLYPRLRTRAGGEGGSRFGIGKEMLTSTDWIVVYTHWIIELFVGVSKLCGRTVIWGKLRRLASATIDAMRCPASLPA